MRLYGQTLDVVTLSRCTCVFTVKPSRRYALVSCHFDRSVGGFAIQMRKLFTKGQHFKMVHIESILNGPYWSILKAFAGDKMNATENLKSVLGRFSQSEVPLHSN